MKILQVIPSFSPKCGGTVNVIYNLTEELAKRGHDVTIITSDYNFDEQYAASLKNVIVNPFKCTINFNEFYYTPSMKKWLRREISFFDVIHMHDFRSYQNVIVCKYAKRNKIPYFVQTHGTTPLIVERIFFKEIFDKVYGFNLMRDAHKVIGVSMYEKRQLLDYGISEDKISIIPNGVKNRGLVKLKDSSIIRTKYCLPDRFTILYVGRLHQGKNIHLLIQAFHHFLQIEPTSILIIGGSGDNNYVQYLHNLVQSLNIVKNVFFTGFVNNPSDLYSIADILVYPCSYEIFGLVPFEAALYDVPVIVADNCGCGEIVESCQGGILVDSGDVLDMAKKLKYAYENKEDVGIMATRLKKYVNKNLKWEKIALNYVNEYKKCANIFID